MTRRSRSATGAIVSAILATASLAEAPTPIPPTPREGRLPWGLYQILWAGPAFAAQLDEEIQLLGRPDYVMFFRDLTRPYPERTCRAIIERGAVPIISMELHRWGQHEENELERIAEGEYDAFFTTYARDACASGQHVWFRFGFEMNGDWFPWGNQRETFIRAWRRVHDIFRAAGANDVLFVWAPNAISGPDTPENGIESYWPGNRYVDVIGLDGYNFGDAYSPYHRWSSFEEIFGPALETIRRSGVKHPVFITEFACTHDVEPARRAGWIRDAHAFLRNRPEVIGALWFNHDKRREGEKNWRIGADAESVRAWRETFARTRGS